jgi:hypothetical protein
MALRLPGRLMVGHLPLEQAIGGSTPSPAAINHSLRSGLWRANHINPYLAIVILFIIEAGIFMI